jgi:hypothetical protein
MRLIESSPLSMSLRGHLSKRVQPECNPTLELNIKLICEDSSTSHENKVARMALAIVAKMIMESVEDACSRASPSRSSG